MDLKSVKPSPTEDQARQIAWKAGALYFMLDKNQQGMYHSFRKSKSPKYVYDVARRVGKSTIMSLIAIEECIRRPNAMVKYGAATQEMVREIVVPIINWTLQSCPQSLQPRYLRHDYCYMFPNGAQLKLIGLDLHPDRLRGQALDLCIIDEAAFVDQLEYVVQSILIPQMQGRPHARILMGSTPPQTPGHAWTTRYVPEAKEQNAYIHRTILDNPRLSLEEKKFFIDEAGGPESITNRRENFAEHIIDDTLAIVPEFLDAEKDVVKDIGRPPYFDSYVSMDPGFKDLTAILFAHYSFEDDKIVVEDEIAIARANTETLARLIRAKESELWGQCQRKDGKSHPMLRFSDVDYRLLADLQTVHQLTFSPTAKDDKEAAINGMRTLIQQRKIVIHPRCKTLIAHLKNGIWNPRRQSFERSGDFGHFDAIDALVYLVRNVHRGSNPFPRFMNGESLATHHIPPESTNGSSLDSLKKAFANKPAGGTKTWTNNTGSLSPLRRLRRGF